MKHPLKKITNPESFVLNRRIGSTHFTVNVHFSEDSDETHKDKVLRLMQNEVETPQETGDLSSNILNFSPRHGTMDTLQAVGVRGGS